MRSMPDPQDKPAMRAWRARRRRQREIRLWLLAVGGVALLALGITAASVTLEPGRAGIWSRIGRHCGGLNLSHHLLPDPIEGQPVVDCFARAYATCQAADMGAGYLQLDGGFTETFVVEPGLGSCSLADYRKSFGVGPDQGATVTCAGMSPQPYGLHIYACGSFGDRVVLSGAANGSPLFGSHCGPITVLTTEFVQNSASASQAVDCFAQAFRACQVATLQIIQALPPTNQESGDTQLTTFLVERHGSGCAIIYLEQYTDHNQEIYYDPDTCANLSRNLDGLRFTCANRGQVVVLVG